MKPLLIFLLLFPTLLFAQEDESKYLTGAVPLVNGRVIFSKQIKAPGLSKAQVYEIALEWAQKEFKTEGEDKKNRVTYSNPEEGEIMCYGDEMMVLKKSTLALDRTRIGYTMNIKCSDGMCETQLTNIIYLYNVSYQSDPIRYEAEKWITDEYALSKNKLLRGTKLFRIKTIDMEEEMVKGLTTNLAKKAMVTPPPTAPAATAVATVAATPKAEEISATQPSDLSGYKKINADKIPGNIIKMLTNDWMLITAGNDSKFNMMTASWGGIGQLYNKPIAICFIAPTRYTYQLMESNDTYTLSFYTEAYRDALTLCGTKSGRDGDKVKESGLTPLTTPAGSKAFGEAWLIVECRKLVSQPIDHNGINDPKLKKDWEGKPMHKMYIGEIINIYVK